MGYSDTIDRVLNNDFEGASDDERERAARNVTMISSLASGGLVLQPIPVLEQGVLAVQIAMVVGIAHVYGEQLTRKRARDVILDIGAVTGVNMVGRRVLTTIVKVALPGLGGVLAAPSTFALTWATGHAAAHYFRCGGKPDREKLKAIFEAEKKRSRAHYSDDRAREARPTDDELESQ